MMTEDQAVSALRARSHEAADVRYLVAVKCEPPPDGLLVSRDSLAEAESKHLELYENGLFVNLMRSGGYLVLEFDKETDAAKALDLVTSDPTGRAIVHSSDVHGSLTRDKALAIINNSAGFSRAFFISQRSQIDGLLIEFGGSDAATLGITDGQGYMAIPEAVRRLTTEPRELLELTGLTNGLALWTIRHALTMPVYAANPIAAVREANKQLAILVGEFQSKGSGKGDLDSVDRLIDLESIHTHQDFETRLKSMRELCSFLDKHAPLPVNSAVYKANVFISSVPLNLSVEQDATALYGVVTMPGLMSGWTRAANGQFILEGLSVAE